MPACVFHLARFLFLTSQPPPVMANGDDAASSEEEKEDASRRADRRVNGTHPAAESTAPGYHPADDSAAERLHGPGCAVNGSHSPLSDEDEDGDEDEALGPGASAVPTIYFSHTVEPKRVGMLLPDSPQRTEAGGPDKNPPLAPGPDRFIGKENRGKPSH